MSQYTSQGFQQSIPDHHPPTMDFVIPPPLLDSMERMTNLLNGNTKKAVQMRNTQLGMLSPKLLWANKKKATLMENVITMSSAPPLSSQKKISVFTDLLQAYVTRPIASQQPTKSLSHK